MDAEGLKEIAQLLNDLSSQDFTDLAESVLGYLKDLGLYKQFEEINRKLYPEGENSMRTYNITNAFVREGIAKGRIEGMEKGILKGRIEGLEQGLEQGRAELQREHDRTQREQVLKMLRKGISMDIIHDITNLSGDEIRTFQKNGEG